jgi:hypothetical protein
MDMQKWMTEDYIHTGVSAAASVFLMLTSPTIHCTDMLVRVVDAANWVFAGNYHLF